MDFEKTAREKHRSGMICSGAVYQTFLKVNPSASGAPVPRSEGGKCGAVLSAEKILRETGAGSIEEFDAQFRSLFGSLKCSDLLGKSRGSCNDYVGKAAEIVGMILLDNGKI